MHSAVESTNLFITLITRLHPSAPGHFDLFYLHSYTVFIADSAFTTSNNAVRNLANSLGVLFLSSSPCENCKK